ncbi:MAG TPA: glycine/betaine ABC transporter permease [Firmicutes bacterium]|jgi:osmoprotectant transport system permease protein|nr:glycine/betaine ABC transporter permease [Bacillota bacterium]
MLDFFLKYHDKLWGALLEHLEIVGITIVLSILLAILLTLFIMRSRLLSQIAVSIFGIIYSIPSLALFALLIPLTGLGAGTAILVLLVYNQFILVRNILAGFDAVNPAVVEAAAGMGMSAWQSFWRIRFPLASPMIIAGIRIAIVSTIGIATIASTINAGGLGTILFDGLRTHNTEKLLWGTILASLLAVVANQLLSLVEKKTIKKIAGEKG